MRRVPIIVQSPASATGWWQAPQPQKTCVAERLDQVVPVLQEVEAWADGGGWAVGYVAYEAGPAFEPALAVRQNQGPIGALPLAWFALCDRPLEIEAPSRRSIEALAWQQVVSRDEYLDRLATIHREIARGNTYQVNFTVPLRTDSPPDAATWFAATRSRDPRACQALLEIPEVDGRGPWSLICLSPELFFESDAETIRSRPMKGTAQPGRDLIETRRLAAELAASEKDRAENVMIVDMVRNDLGRIAETGSVKVPKLFEVEHHPTVLQMTSTVTACTRASLAEIFAALFPCASITGAPKIATARIIAELEVQPRGVYTGAIGWVGPGRSGKGRQARFGVAIRTAVIDRRQGIAEYCVGSGVVWDSDPEREYQECAAKAAIVSRPRAEHELYETMLWEPSRGLVLADRHRSRIQKSAEFLQVPVDRKELLQAFAQLTDQQHWQTPHRLRLVLSRSGEISVEDAALEPLPNPVAVAFAHIDADPDDPCLWHKTTAREIYQRALDSHPEVDDVLLVSRQGEVTESTIANLVLNLEGRWLTPRRESGLLDGTLRADLLEADVIEEATVTSEMVRSAQALYLVNSVRGWMPAELVNREW